MHIQRVVIRHPLHFFRIETDHAHIELRSLEALKNDSLSVGRPARPDVVRGVGCIAGELLRIPSARVCNPDATRTAPRCVKGDASAVRRPRRIVAVANEQRCFS